MCKRKIVLICMHKKGEKPWDMKTKGGRQFFP